MFLIEENNGMLGLIIYYNRCNTVKHNLREFYSLASWLTFELQLYKLQLKIVLL